MAYRPGYRLIVATYEQIVLGFAAVFAPPDEHFALLEYLAVDESARGRGIGAGLFRATVDALHGEGRARMLLVEVEADVAAGDDAEREARRRRLAFYRRLGCRRIADLDYQLPLRTAGIPPAMHLLVHRPPDDAPVPRADLARALRTVYADVYDQSPDDPRIAQMLARVADPVSLV
jgi:GNAT superfamily N-acetyltransferase